MSDFEDAYLSPTTYHPPLLASAARHTRTILGAMADEALGLILAGVTVLARLAWLFGAVCFMAAAVLSLIAWGTGHTSDAWTTAYLGALSLGIMGAARWVGYACTVHRFRGAE